LRCEALVIGGGATGAGIARDLSMRGMEVILLERGDFSAGATGRSHGMLHSGARYAVKDPDSARECAVENEVLKRIAPFCIEDTGGIYLGINDSDASYLDDFMRGCSNTGVKAEEITVREAKEKEPQISPGTQVAVSVLDAYIDPFFLTQANVAEARAMGAEVRNHCEVVGMDLWEDTVMEVRIRDRRSTSLSVVKPDMVINATGAWGSRIASMVGLEIPIRVDKGSLVIMNGRKVNGLVNRLRLPSDGDIIVPSHSSSIVGTTCDEISSPDDCVATIDEVKLLIQQAAEMVPSIGETRAVRAYAGIRPLPAGGDEGRDISRTFKLIDHYQEGVVNMVSIIGGKLTTYRLMAEKVSDLVMEKLGNRGKCRTASQEIGGECSDHEFDLISDLQAGRMAAKYGAACRDIAGECSRTLRGREMLCSCEQVLRGEAVYFAQTEDVLSIADILRRTRAGMGYCQAGMCVTRVLSVLDEWGEDPLPLLQDFLDERWKGVQPVLFDNQLRQELLKVQLFKSLSLERKGGDGH
jgi:glycerol-3-phosphate dehydrogenase